MLDHAGRQAQRRGAMAVASSAFRRAAELSEPAQRNRRLLAAAQRAYELGRPDLALPLLREVADHHPAPLERARATWVEEMIDPRPLEDEERVGALLAAAAEAGEAGDRELQIDLVWLVAQRAWWVDPGPDARRLLINAADRLGDAGSEDLRVLAIYAYADPFGHAAAVVERLRIAAHSNRRTIQPDAARHLGPAALVAGAFDLGKPLLDAAADGLRLEGRLGHLPRILALQSISAAWLADWDRAIPAAAEARRLAEELRDTLWAAGGDVGASLIAGIRGDADVVREASARAERIGTAARANFMVALAQLGPVIAALGESRHADALARAQRLFDPGDSAYHPVMCSWLISELAEAALHLNRLDEGRARLADVEKTVGRSPGNGIEVGLRHARALLADDCEAEACFEHALDARLGSWPFQHARIKLAYGQWLRRRRRIAESRTPLRTARDAFDELGCAAWADQARRELRASGESSRRRTPDARDQLTAQELQIAHLAAQGLSNRQIGQRLYLSHRTVGTHLYRIFPKLGITARTELSSALSND
jgi:DNA-binding CsgD family transcriptional regulator